MIRLAWMVGIALGFMVSGIALWEGQWQTGAILFVAAWIWMAFPKVVAWLCRLPGRMMSSREAKPVKT